MTFTLRNELNSPAILLRSRIPSPSECSRGDPVVV